MYQAFAGPNTASGFLDTEEQAVAWAKKHMAKANAERVVICQSIAIVVRPTPDVKVLSLPQPPAPLHTPEQIEEKQQLRHPTSGVHDNGYDFTGRDMEQANPSNRT